MYRRELNIVMGLTGVMGLLLLVVGASSHSLPVVGLVLLGWVSLTNTWIVAKDRMAIRKSCKQGCAVLVPMQAGWPSSTLALRQVGFRHPGGPATEYHVRPRSGEGPSVLRKAMADLDRITNDAACPSLHIFAWHGMRSDKVERLLRPFLQPEDKLATWQRGDVAFGVVAREGRHR